MSFVLDFLKESKISSHFPNPQFHEWGTKPSGFPNKVIAQRILNRGQGGEKVCEQLIARGTLFLALGRQASW